jgi:hypothetical protein
METWAFVLATVERGDEVKDARQSNTQIRVLLLQYR